MCSSDLFPSHDTGSIGGILVLLGLLILLYLTGIKLFTGQAIGGRPLLLFGVLFVVSGLQIFFTGFIAELLTNMTQRDAFRFPLQYSSDTV